MVILGAHVVQSRLENDVKHEPEVWAEDASRHRWPARGIQDKRASTPKKQGSTQDKQGGTQDKQGGASRKADMTSLRHHLRLN